eukprot:TRINITY_DN4040_c0_g1_i1.p3 TRINITY_DN4040_c0_g1~~TRINITY_DN4040_c0_g1_i1.p3  ORF type:complete len:55 (+),score=19.44 TRINITY_DN4040_c0_g1_i1:247-411(+)
MNADRMAETPAKKAMVGMDGMLGTVIINLQKTNLDDKTTIRVGRSSETAKAHRG